MSTDGRPGEEAAAVEGLCWGKELKDDFVGEMALAKMFHIVRGAVEA